jgi:hypothetical protein
MPKYYPILDNGVSPMASKKSGYNKSGGKKNDPNRAKFVDKYVKQNTKSADRPATKKQARNAYYLTSVDDKKGTRGAKSTGAKAKTPAGSMMRTRADGTKAGTRSGSTSGTRADGNKPGARVRGMDNAGPNVRAGVGRKATYPPKSAGMAGASKEPRVAGKSTRNPSWSSKGKPVSTKRALGELWMMANAANPEGTRVVPKSRGAKAREGLGTTGRGPKGKLRTRSKY